MGKWVLSGTYSSLSIALLLMATPQPAHAYVDPGSGAMIWQILAAAVIGSLFYVRKVFKWVRDQLGVHPTRISPDLSSPPLLRRLRRD